MAIFSVDPKSAGLLLRAAGQKGDPSCFHARTIQECLDQLASRRSGLSPEEAAARLKKNRPNDIDALDFGRGRHIFLGGFRRKITLLYMAAAGLSFATGQMGAGLVVLAAMFANAGLNGLIQWKSIQGGGFAVEASAIRCSVRRGGQTQIVNAAELVPGDILVLSGGQVVPADCRLIDSDKLQVDESLLTGESILVAKNALAMHEPNQSVSSQSNMIFAGTRVKTGQGEALVTATGTRTVMGRIAAMSRNTEKRESPFTRRLNILSNRIFLMVFVLAALVIAIEAQRGTPLPQLLSTALILAIAAFPETIPGISSLILTMGIGRLGRNQVLVKNYQALEAVGDVTLVCSDKTGTLTENYLTFDQLFLPELGSISYNPMWQQGQGIVNRALEEFLRIARLNNNTVLEGLSSPLMGDPIDIALFRSAPASLEAGYHRRMHVPFDTETMRSATLCEGPDGRLYAMIKGAPEAVMETCNWYMAPDGTIKPLSLMNRMEFMSYNRKLATANNLRIIGFAEKVLTDDDASGPYSNAVFIGWVCLLDPPKPGVVEAIDQLWGAGTRLMMITGDQKATAEITAQELGILRGNNDEVWLRSDLDRALEAGEPIRETVRVFARTKPEEKLAIVESLQQSGQIVAMVGDGVNDSPALQKSDVAIAMGRQGSEAAKDSADIILLDDRLGGIVEAIRESRLMRRKVRACIQYLLSCNLGLIFFVVASVVAGQGVSLNVVQLLCLNLVMAVLPTLALALEPTEPDGMPEREPMPDPLDKQQLGAILFWGLLICGVGLASYLIPLLVFKLGPAVAGTMAFCALATAQTLNLFNVQACKTDRKEAFWDDMLTMPVTWLVVSGALLVQAGALYVGPISQLLGTVRVEPLWMLLPVGLAAAAMAASVRTALSLRRG